MPGQKDLAKVYPHLSSDLHTLESDVPNLTDTEIAWRFARILASAHVAHNTLYTSNAQQLPLTVEWLDDGPLITGATAEFQHLVGKRILRVGPLSIEEFLTAVSPYLAYETESWRRLLAGALLPQRGLLDAVHAVRTDRVELTLDEIGSAALPLVSAPSMSPWDSLQKLLVNRHPEQPYYWGEFLDDGTLYIQYRQCADDPRLAFTTFATQTLAEIDHRQPRRVIVDVRFNTGGNQSILNPLTAGLSARRKQIGAPIVLTGASTFSSGVRAADDLRKKAGAYLIGATTGGLYGGYGESPSRTLPHSKLSFQWTIKYFAHPEPVIPDLKVEITAADVRAGRDPVLQAALSTAARK